MHWEEFLTSILIVRAQVWNFKPYGIYKHMQTYGYKKKCCKLFIIFNLSQEKNKVSWQDDSKIYFK